mgnify:CR=1 FL=1
MIKYSKLKKSRELQRRRRHQRLRNRISGHAERPRLVVFRSLKHMEAQLVDDVAGVTLIGASTAGLKDFKAEGQNRRVEMCAALGERIGAAAREKGINSVVFDRGGYKYHGRVKAFADGARKGGLEF